MAQHRAKQSDPRHAFIKSFNGRLRDELLNETLLPSLNHARATLAAWRTDDNTERPHPRLGWQTPAQFAQTFTPQRDPTEAQRAQLRARPRGHTRQNGKSSNQKSHSRWIKVGSNVNHGEHMPAPCFLEKGARQPLRGSPCFDVTFQRSHAEQIAVRLCARDGPIQPTISYRGSVLNDTTEYSLQER